MNTKEVLLTGLKKTYLNLTGVDDYYIFWNADMGTLNLSSFVSAHGTSTLCKTKIKDTGISNSTFVLGNPDKLLKILGISGEDLNVELPTNTSLKLVLRDSVYESNFSLCDPSSIGVSLPDLEEPLSYDIQIELTDELSQRFIQAKKANGSEFLSVEVTDQRIKLQLGDNTDYSNKISFFLDEPGMFDIEKTLFSSDIIEEIFVRNKGTKGRLFVSSEGLMKIAFSTDTTETTYFIVALDKL